VLPDALSNPGSCETQSKVTIHIFFFVVSASSIIHQYNMKIADDRTESEQQKLYSRILIFMVNVLFCEYVDSTDPGRLSPPLQTLSSGSV
jgi:hypothetical protein